MSTHSGRKKRLLVMFLLTFSYMIAELSVGYFANSIALIADSFHMLSDVISLIVAFISIMLSPKKWKKSTFGWARAEVLGALINSVFLIALCFSILMESVQRFVSPQVISEFKWVLGVGIGGLVVNLIGLCIFHEGHGHSHGHSVIQNQGRLTRLVVPDQDENESESGFASPAPDFPTSGSGKSSPAGNSSSPLLITTAAEQILAAHVSPAAHRSRSNIVSANGDAGAGAGAAAALPSPARVVDMSIMSETEPVNPKKKVKASHQLNMRGVYLHIMADTMGSVVVIISAIIVWTTETARASDPETYRFVFYVDPVLSVIMVTLIVISAWPLLQETSMILLQTVPTYLEVDDLKMRLRRDVAGILGIHEFHIWQLAGDRVIASIHIICRAADYMRISLEAKLFFHSNGIHSTTIQAEFVSYDGTSPFDEKGCLLICPTNGNPTETCTTSTCCGTSTDN